jgi:FkbM family methyltransferase
MSAIGKYMRIKTPRVYFFLTGLQRKYVGLNRPYYMYITDSLGGDFKEYFKKNNLNELKNELSLGLDTESQHVVNVVSSRLVFYPNESNKAVLDKNSEIVGGLLQVEQDAVKINDYISEESKQYTLSEEQFSDSVFYFDHGLALMPKSALEYVENEDFIDLGAYVGDSAIALTKYNYKKIYSVEMSKRSMLVYEENVGRNGISKDRYKLINIAICDQENLPDIELPDTGSAGFSLMRERGKYDYISIQQRTLDSIVTEHGIKPKFIKVDIEGYAMHFVKGGLETIQKFRPVLSIAIYHNPTEFYEIKPLLEKELVNYSFCIRKMTSETKDNNCHSEVVLMAYPSEIDGAVKVV